MAGLGEQPCPTRSESSIIAPAAGSRWTRAFRKPSASPGHLSLRYPMEVNLIGDAKSTLSALLDHLAQTGDLSWQAWPCGDLVVANLGLFERGRRPWCALPPKKPIPAPSSRSRNATRAGARSI